MREKGSVGHVEDRNRSLRGHTGLRPVRTDSTVEIAKIFDNQFTQRTSPYEGMLLPQYFFDNPVIRL